MNLFDYSTPEKGEIFDTLFRHKNIEIKRIISSEYFEPMEYCQIEDEWVILIEGEATLLVDNQKKSLQKGNSLFIPANTPHKILTMKQGTLWLAVHIF